MGSVSSWRARPACCCFVIGSWKGKAVWHPADRGYWRIACPYSIGSGSHIAGTSRTIRGR